MVNGFRFTAENIEPEDSGDQKIESNNSVEQALARNGVSHRARTSKMKNPRLKQITTLLYLHARLINKGTGRARSVDEMQRLRTKMVASLEILSPNDAIRSSLHFLIKVIDNWFV